MSNNYNLSEGSLKTIMKGEQISNPIVQVLGSKKINSGNSDKERYRILLSDGIYTISFAMLTTQVNDTDVIASLQTNTIIKLKRYLTSVINNTGKKDTRVLLIMELEMVVPGSEVGDVIGSPTPLSDVTTSINNTENNLGTPSKKPKLSNDTITTTTIPNSNQSSNITPSCSTSQIISPISSLSPYHNKWIIKVRVLNKSDLRTWSNSRGEGKLFSVDLVDESDEIRCTFFKEQADKFFDYLQVDHVYFISKCQLKPANKQYSTLKNDYEMTGTSETIIEECKDDVGTIPQTKYDFLSIDKIAMVEVGSVIDIIGVCKSTTDVVNIIAKSTGRELKKREVTLVDQSNNSIALTLWGSQAENFDGSSNPVVVIKGVKVGEFGGGKNITPLMGSQIKLNPDIPESYRIKGWFDAEGHKLDMKSVSARVGISNFSTPWMTFKAVQEKELGKNDKGDYFQVLGTVLLIRSENAVYKACPSTDCNKKVLDLNNGLYRCEKCCQEYPNFKYRMLASMNVGDWSGNQWISMFATEAEKVLGVTSQELGEMLENNPEDANEIFDKANFKQFIFKCRTKMETYNDESRLKTVAVKVDSVHYSEHNAYLISEIKKLIEK